MTTRRLLCILTLPRLKVGESSKCKEESISFVRACARTGIFSLISCFIFCLNGYPALQAPQKIIITADELQDDHFSSFLDIIQVRGESAAQSIADLLAFQKGITVHQHGGQGSAATLNIRGIGAGKAEQILVLLDGIRLNAARGLGADLSQIPLSIVEKIEVIRGGESALYGADAVGGVINIVTRTDPAALNYQLSRDSWNEDSRRDHHLSLKTARRIGPFSLSFIVHSDKNQGNYHYQNPVTFEREQRESNGFFSKGFLLKADWEAPSHLTFSLLEEFFHSEQALIFPLMPDG